MIDGYSCFNDWFVRDPHLIIGAEDFDEGVLSFAFQKKRIGRRALDLIWRYKSRKSSTA